MLMMLAALLSFGSGWPADAHDVGRGSLIWVGEGQLMLMMLAALLSFGSGMAS